MNCTGPPGKPAAGTWEWSGDLQYGTQVLYTCGPVGNFKDSDGFLYEETISSCAWNRTWSPPVLDPCAATACQEIPFPPKSIGLEHVPDPKNPITMASEFSKYNPSLPLTMNFPGPSFCRVAGQKLMVVARIPEDAEDLLQIAFMGPGINEAFHLSLDVDQEYIALWAVIDNATTAVTGDPWDGTTIDRDEPFVIRCCAPHLTHRCGQYSM